jgi:hypothetical protein
VASQARRSASQSRSTTSTPQEKARDDDEILSLYESATGSCFRCARTDLDATRLKELHQPAGVRYDVRACRACDRHQEVERQQHAARTGAAVPGYEWSPGGNGARRAELARAVARRLRSAARLPGADDPIGQQ